MATELSKFFSQASEEVLRASYKDSKATTGEKAYINKVLDSRGLEMEGPGKGSGKTQALVERVQAQLEAQAEAQAKAEAQKAQKAPKAS